MTHVERMLLSSWCWQLVPVTGGDFLGLLYGSTKGDPPIMGLEDPQFM